MGSVVIGRQLSGVTPVDTVDSAGHAIRYWLPQGVTGPMPLVIWNHPDSHTQMIDPGYWAYSLIHAMVQEGYAVVASYLHNRSWGNAASLTDVVNAYNFMQSLVGVSKLVLAGASMGGLPSLLTIATGGLPTAKVKGAALIDAVCSLRALYDAGTYTSVIQTAHGMTVGTTTAATAVGATSLPTTASYPTTGTVLLVDGGAQQEAVTTTGPSTGTAVPVAAMTKAHASGVTIADYASKTQGKDPMLYPASTFAGQRYRFWAANADASVARGTNADAFASLVTGATELTVVSHAAGHLDTRGAQPRDLVGFLRRCFA